MRNIPVNKKYLIACIAMTLLLCITQIMGYRILVLGCLGMHMVLIAWCCAHDFSLPILLFLMPWAPLMKLSPGSASVYAFGMIIICMISVIKKGLNLRNYQLIAGIAIFIVTATAKMLDGYFLSVDYIAFLMMIVLFPSVKEEWREKKYDFYQVVVFLAVGVVLASLCALMFANYANIRKFIDVAAFQTIIRRSGFYGDANFYTAHIVAAMGGVLSLLLTERKKGRLVFLGIAQAFLLYCGFLSGSKSFALVTVALLLLWVIGILNVRGRGTLKVILIVFLIAGVIYIATSSLFSSLIQVLMTRFSSTTDFRSFTTGRTDQWVNHMREILTNAKIFFLGKGFTNVRVNGRASHNSIIQILFQFGVIGTPVLTYWIVCFFRDAVPAKKRFGWPDVKNVMVFAGAFVPWLAIDMLFFDEFFLMQWYMLLALNYFRTENKNATLDTLSYGG